MILLPFLSWDQDSAQGHLALIMLKYYSLFYDYIQSLSLIDVSADQDKTLINKTVFVAVVSYTVPPELIVSFVLYHLLAPTHRVT